jgi:hypothetical protein
VTGALLGLFSLALLGAGGAALWADLTQREGGYVTTDVHNFSSSGSALTTVSTELGSAGVGWLYSPDLMDKVRIRVTPATDEALFVGIGPSVDVDRYLAAVSHTVISEFWEDRWSKSTALGRRPLLRRKASGSHPPVAAGPRTSCGMQRTGRGPSS